MSSVVSAEEATRRLAEVLVEKAEQIYGAGSTVKDLHRLSEGASRETWSFDVISADGTQIPLILKRDPVFYEPDGSIRFDTGFDVDREVEGRLVELSKRAGVPAPEVPFYLTANDRTSPGFVMERLVGETLGRRIVREQSLEAARPKLAYQCGHAAARFHTIPLSDLPLTLPKTTPAERLDGCRSTLDKSGHAYPGFEYAIAWLAERIELAGDRIGLVHGDFRNGNILVGPDGLRGVLDWELAHQGNPLADLGWLCVRSWRYGYLTNPVGGFGQVDDLLAGYEAGGGPTVDPQSLHFWEVFGTLFWGTLCVNMAFAHLNGSTGSLEQAVIGRRTAETEYDLLDLID